MTPTSRAHVIVKQFQDDGHPYYDELVEMIANGITAAVADQRQKDAEIRARLASDPIKRITTTTYEALILARDRILQTEFEEYNR